MSRFLRNLKQTLIAVEDHLHAAGVVVLFADERLLSSDPGNWDQFVREAHEAEAYSRKLSKRVGEGYAAKRRRLGVPGGNRAPYGIIREGKPSTLRVDDGTAPIVVQAYRLAAAGSTDWEVATQTGLAKTHVGELLTNPIYAGRLRTGETAGIAPIVDPALWSTVQTMRERRRTRAPGRIVNLTPTEVVSYLRSLPALWTDAGPEGRQAMATALFANTDVLGYQRMEYELTPAAIELGLGAALPAVFELGNGFGEFGRGERT